MKKAPSLRVPAGARGHTRDQRLHPLCQCERGEREAYYLQVRREGLPGEINPRRALHEPHCMHLQCFRPPATRDPRHALSARKLTRSPAFTARVCRVSGRHLSGCLSGSLTHPTTIGLFISMGQMQFVGFVGFSQVERAPENSVNVFARADCSGIREAGIHPSSEMDSGVDSRRASQRKVCP